MKHEEFRHRYLLWTDVENQLRQWADAHPDIARLESLGTTQEGRSLWMLILGRNSHEKRPAVWIDGNMHATEVAGTSVALAIAEDVLSLHLDKTAHEMLGLRPHIAEQIRETLFYIMPRVSPDGAEAVLTSGIYKRSVPRDGRQSTKPHWRLTDINGDGLVRYMRVVDATGDFAAHPKDPDLLVPRTLDDVGPFYKIYPEGVIENFGGHHIPAPHYLSDNGPDLNRNFPFHWRSEREQVGAGVYPGSEAESRAILDFASAHPNIFAWLNLHTFGGCFIRPPGDRADEKMPPYDLAIYRELGDIAEAATRYPMVSGFKEFLYEPDKPLHGALSEWAYEERGAFASVCELWDLFAELGMPRPPKFVDYYTKLDRDWMLRFKTWDQEKNAGRVFVPWVAFDHPQLGAVEVGGIDRLEGLFNPPRERLAEICRGQSTFVMALAARCPRLVLETKHKKENGRHQLEVSIENQGYWPLYGAHISKSHPWNEAPSLTLTTEGTLQLCGAASPTREHRLGPHLEGWGRGKDSFSAFHPDATGNGARWVSLFTLEGAGTLTVALQTARAGIHRKDIQLD